MKFNRLLIIRRDEENPYKNVKWLCLCDCGVEKSIAGIHLVSGATKSCGCLQREGTSNRRHGLSKQRFYSIWFGIKKRCLNTNHSSYRYYGGRGITICDRWVDSFENFKEDMHESYLEHVNLYSVDDTTIERVDNMAGYEKTNCTWATRAEQTKNRRQQSNQKWFVANPPVGEPVQSNSIRAISLEYSLDRCSVSRCLRGVYKKHKGWTFCYA